MRIPPIVFFPFYFIQCISSDVIPESSGCGAVAGSDNVSNTPTQIPGNFNFSNQCWYI